MEAELVEEYQQGKAAEKLNEIQEAEHICGYAGSGNVLKMQFLLNIYSDSIYESTNNPNKEKVNNLSEAQDVALMAMGKGVGAEMPFGSFGKLLRYYEQCFRHGGLQALELVAAAKPKLNVIKALSKFCHDTVCTVISGRGRAGTNHAHLAAILRQLAHYYSSMDPSNSFIMRMLNNLTHLGRITIAVNPYLNDSLLIKPRPSLFSLLDIRNLISGRSHYVLYIMVPTIQAHLLIAFVDELKQFQVPIRVCLPASGFDITPVLLGLGEYAESATDEYITHTPVLEGFVYVLMKSPEYEYY